jgi:hypothetical protein
VPRHVGRSTILAAALVVGAAVAPYLPTLDDYFVQDDFGVVWLLADKPWSTFPRWFHTTWMDDIWGYTPDEIRPFPALSYRIAAMAGAGSPVANHVINVAFHAANGLLVLALARFAAGLALVPATAAAVVFVVLPVQAESVAWVTGRVDSMPAFFYLAAFVLYARWRATSSPALYLSSLAAFVAALFSKQNTITLAPALLLYDLLAAPQPFALAARVRAYVPYAAATLGYLLLRWFAFGEVARESALTAERFGYFMADAAAHVRHIVAGATMPTVTGRVALAAVAMLAALAAGAAWRRPREISALARAALFFGVVWVALGIAPTLVAGYASPRHVYLAAAGWAVLVGALLEAGRRAGPAGVMRPVAFGAAVILIGAYVVQGTRVVDDWRARAALSRAAVLDLEREALAAPPGTLIIAGAPAPSWAFALPFAARPPFARADLTSRVTIISHSSLHCCPAHIWEPYTRGAMRAWLARPDRPPVLALYWDPRTGAFGRLDENEEPFLRPLVTVLLETDSVAALDRAMVDALEAMVAPRARLDR